MGQSLVAAMLNKGGTASTEESSSFDDASSEASSRSDIRAGVGMLELADKNSSPHKRKSKRVSSRNYKGATLHTEREEAPGTLKKEPVSRHLSLLDFRLGFHNALLVNDELTLTLLIGTYHSFFSAWEFLDVIKTTYVPVIIPVS